VLVLGAIGDQDKLKAGQDSVDLGIVSRIRSCLSVTPCYKCRADHSDLQVKVSIESHQWILK
jgi:hypothetical protein